MSERTTRPLPAQRIGTRDAGPARPLPHPAPSRPGIALPPGACDTHCHVLGPAAVFPYASDRPFTPVDVPGEQVMALHDLLGFDRGVIVQSTCHGTDHRALLDLLAAGAGRYRGVALVRPDTASPELARLHGAGVRGARLHFAPHLGAAPSGDELRGVVDLVRDLGWHLELHLLGDAVAELAGLIARLPVPVVIDHMGRVDLAEGPHGRSVDALRRLLDTGGVWVKVSGADRISRTGPPFADGVALARLLVDHAPERTLWGTDYPHVNIAGPAPDDGLLVDLLGQIAPDRAALERLLVTNPSEFFDFG